MDALSASRDFFGGQHSLPSLSRCGQYSSSCRRRFFIASTYLSTISTVHVCRSGSLQMTKKPVYSLISAKRICRTHRPHTDSTSTSHRPHIDPTSTAHRPHIDLTSTLHRPHINPHQKNINVSKHFILGHL